MNKRSQINENSTQYMSYNICVNFFVYSYYGETKIYKINSNFKDNSLATLFSVVSLLLGIWKIPFLSWTGNSKTVWNAINSNFSGGNSYTSHLQERKYDERTNYVFNNLERQTKEKIDRTRLNELLNLFDAVEESSKDNEEILLSLQANASQNLRTIFRQDDFECVFRTIENYYKRDITV